MENNTKSKIAKTFWLTPGQVAKIYQSDKEYIEIEISGVLFKFKFLREIEGPFIKADDGYTRETKMYIIDNGNNVYEGSVTENGFNKDDLQITYQTPFDIKPNYKSEKLKGKKKVQLLVKNNKHLSLSPIQTFMTPYTMSVKEIADKLFFTYTCCDEEDIKQNIKNKAELLKMLTGKICQDYVTGHLSMVMDGFGNEVADDVLDAMYDYDEKFLKKLKLIK